MTRLDLKLNNHLENCVCTNCGVARDMIEQLSKMKRTKKIYKGKLQA